MKLCLQLRDSNIDFNNIYFINSVLLKKKGGGGEKKK